MYSYLFIFPFFNWSFIFIPPSPFLSIQPFLVIFFFSYTLLLICVMFFIQSFIFMCVSSFLFIHAQVSYLFFVFMHFYLFNFPLFELSYLNLNCALLFFLIYLVIYITCFFLSLFRHISLFLPLFCISPLFVFIYIYVFPFLLFMKYFEILFSDRKCNYNLTINSKFERLIEIHL